MLPEFNGYTTIHVVLSHRVWKMVTARQGKEFAKRIGLTLAKQRLARKLTQEQVAKKLGVEQETISRFERGATLPPLLRLLDLAEIFEVSLDEIVRAGSPRTIDQVNDLVASLNMLNEPDRIWIQNWVTEMCTKLSNRS